MSIDFTLTEQQREMQHTARRFANQELRPVTEAADRLVDPWESFLATKGVYQRAYELGFAMSFIPVEYGGPGASNLDLQIVAEELCAVDPGFACTLLVNGLTLLPILWYGSEEQKDTWLRRAVADPERSFLGGWIVSEPGGTANFDSPAPHPAGIQVTATHDKSNGEYVLNGRKMWNTNGCGWDKEGADVNVVIARLDRAAGGNEGLAAFIVPRGTPGYSTTGILDTLGHRTTVQPELLFEECRIPETNLLPGSAGNGDLVITKAFTWSGPVAAIASVGVMRSAFDFAHKWCRDYGAASGSPIIELQNVGYLLANIKMKIEAARYLSWKAAHYLDCHAGEGQEGGALAKIFCGELAVEAVNEAMRVVGINSYLKDYPLQKHMRDALCFPIYDAGNMGMQRRRLHGIIADPGYDPMAFAQNLRQNFKKTMLGMDTQPGHRRGDRGASAGAGGPAPRRPAAVSVPATGKEKNKMSVLSTIELVLADEAAEQRFLQAFTRAMAYTDKIPGLISITAWKKVGAERTYMAFTEWEDEQAIEAWMTGEAEQRNIAMAQGELCSATASSRWTLRNKKAWQREG